MGKLSHIEIENFKSYGGVHLIGPFEDFTCIVGPNGAGKSNLMDAISFVVGVQSRQLRSANLKELIFRKNELSAPAKKASVQITYVLSEEEQRKKSSPSKKNQSSTELTFKRIIHGSGTSSFRFQDKEVTYDEYVGELKKIGVLVKVRNFLVFQGDVESIASKSPIELTKWIEHICDADQLVPEYDALLKLRSEAQEATVFALQKRKMFVNQCKEVKEQKDEADLYQQLTEELHRFQSDFVLWRVWHSLHDLATHHKSVSSTKEEVDLVDDEISSLNSQISQIKKQTANDSINSTKEKRILSIRQDLAKLKSNLSTISAKRKALNKKLSDITVSKQKVEVDASTQAQDLNVLRSDLARIANDLSMQNNELDSLLSSRRLLSPAQLQQYSELKEVASARTLTSRTEYTTTEMELKSLQKEISMECIKFEGLKADIAYHQQAFDDHDKRQGRVLRELKEVESDLRSCENERLSTKKKIDSNASLSSQLVEKLNGIDERLRNAGDDRRRSKHEQRLSDAIETMQGIIPGVYGRLHDLCRPIQKQYSLAITVAGGKFMDAVVVENSKTAASCIQYLKEQRIGVCTFIPLSSIRDTALPDRYRSFGANFKPCVDLVSCEEYIKPAVNFAFDRAIVCDSLQSARVLCYEKGEQVKVVTLQGHIIHRSGSMTGGVARETADIWESKEIDRLQKEKANLENRLTELQDSGSRELLYDLEGKVRQLQIRADILRAEKASTEQRLAHLKSYIETKSIEYKEVEQRVSRLKMDELRVTTKMNDIQQQIVTTEEEIFRKLSEQIGVTNIRLLDDDTSVRTDIVRQRISQLKSREAEIRGQIEYINSRNFSGTLKRLQDEETAVKRELLKLGDSEKVTLEKRDSAAQQLEKEEEEFNRLESIHLQRKAKIADLAQKKVDLETKKKSLLTRISNEENASFRLVNQIRDHLRTSPVELPTTGNETLASDGISLADPSILDISPAGKKNFVNLSGLKKRLPPVTEEHEISNFFERNIKERVAQLESMQPNLHAAEKLKSLMEKVNECSDDLDKVKDDFVSASTRFEVLQKQRKQRFESCFNHIAVTLNKIYKDLTKSVRHPMGGNASLTLENVDEPYLGGVRFTAMPPMKRFRDMEQLSGGEKTVAALALLFSIHSYHPAPFFVLDEIDAALDNVNVNKVCSYVRERSSEFQCIVISLKDTFFSTADSLVGTCRDLGTFSSKTFSLDLKKFAVDESMDNLAEV